MFWFTIITSILCSVSGYSYTKRGPLCDATDFKCIADITTDMVQASLSGIEDIGVVPLDPLHIPLIEGEIPDLKYSLSDCTLKGIKGAVINDLTIEYMKSMHFDITIPEFEISGQYKINGKLLNLEAIGEGPFYLNATDVNVIADVKKTYYEKDGKTHLKLEDLKATSNTRGELYLDVQNLFGGNMKLAEPVLKLIKEHPKAVAQIMENAVCLANMQVMFDDYNKILETIPINALVKEKI